MKKLLQEPLLHFLFIAAGLFAIFGLTNPTNTGETDRRIVVSAGRIEQLTAIFRKTWQRPPTRDELQRLIDDFVLEEAYYRKAVAMGLDRDDTIIRRRLRQKLEYISDDAALLAEPTEEDLDAYLAKHPDKFRQSPTYTFRQLYFNPERHGDDPKGYIEAQLELLRSGKPIQPDPSLLPESFERVSRQAVDGAFGRGFSLKLDALAVNEWQGPVRSGLGLHLIRLETRTPGRLPTLVEIRPVVQREWSNEKRIANRRRFNQRLLEDYQITIEWPDEKTTKKDLVEGEAP